MIYKFSLGVLPDKRTIVMNDKHDTAMTEDQTRDINKTAHHVVRQRIQTWIPLVLPVMGLEDTHVVRIRMVIGKTAHPHASMEEMKA